MASFLRLLGLDELRFAHALRSAIALCFAFAFWAWQQPPVGYYVPLTVGLVLLPGLGATFRQCMLRIVGVLLGGAISVLLVNLARYGEVAFVAATCATFVVLAFLGASQTYAGSNRGYTFFTAIVQICFLVFPYVNTGTWFDLNFVYRVVNTLTGIAIVMVVASIVFPARAARALRSQLAGLREGHRRALGALLARVSGRAASAEDEAALAALRTPSPIWTSLDELVGQAAAEDVRVQHRETAWRSWIAAEWRQRRRLLALEERARQSERSETPSRSDEQERAVQLDAILAGRQAFLDTLGPASRETRRPASRVAEPINPARVERAIAGGIAALVAMYAAWGLTLVHAAITVLLAIWVAAFPQTRRQAVGLTAAAFVSAWFGLGLVVALQAFYLPHVERLGGLLLALFPLALLLAYVGSDPRPPGALLQAVLIVLAMGLAAPGYEFQRDLTPTYDIVKALSLGALIGAAAHLALWPSDERRGIREWAALALERCRRLLVPELRDLDDEDLASELTALAASTQRTLGNQLKILALLPEDARAGSLRLIEAQQEVCDHVSGALAIDRMQAREAACLADALGEAAAALRSARHRRPFEARLERAQALAAELEGSRSGPVLGDLLAAVGEAAAEREGSQRDAARPGAAPEQAPSGS